MSRVVDITLIITADSHQSSITDEISCDDSFKLAVMSFSSDFSTMVVTAEKIQLIRQTNEVLAF
jgi:hypothetical protein